MSTELAERPDDSERFLIAYSLLRGMAREEGNADPFPGVYGLG
jgi:hypothetical protein